MIGKKLERAFFTRYGKIRVRLGRGQALASVFSQVWTLAAVTILLFNFDKMYAIYALPFLLLLMYIFGVIEDRKDYYGKELEYGFVRNPEWNRRWEKLEKNIDELKNNAKTESINA